MNRKPSRQAEEQMNGKPSRQAEVLLEAERFCKSRTKSFSDDAEVLDALGLLVRLRTTPPADHSGTQARRLSSLKERATIVFNERFDRSPLTLHAVNLPRELELNAIEREILLVLIASEFGIVPSVRDIEDLQKVMNRHGAESLAIARALTSEAILVASETVSVDEDAPRVRRGLFSTSLPRCRIAYAQGCRTDSARWSFERRNSNTPSTEKPRLQGEIACIMPGTP